MVILSGPELLEKHRDLHGSPVPSPEKYIVRGNGHVLLVGRADSIQSIQVLEHCDNGLIAKVHFKQAMVIEDGTELRSMTILGGYVSDELHDFAAEVSCDNFVHLIRKYEEVRVVLGSFGRYTSRLEAACKLVCTNPDPSKAAGGIWVRGINGQPTGPWKSDTDVRESAVNSFACKLKSTYTHMQYPILYVLSNIKGLASCSTNEHRI